MYNFYNVVTGRHFILFWKHANFIDSLRTLQFVFQQCVVLSNSNMACPSPNIVVQEPLDAEHPLPLQYGFRMDNVTGVQNLSIKEGYSFFLLYPNPVYEPFDEEVKYYKSDYLTINVRILEV
jgi:plexin A